VLVVGLVPGCKALIVRGSHTHRPSPAASNGVDGGCGGRRSTSSVPLRRVGGQHAARVVVGRLSTAWPGGQRSGHSSGAAHPAVHPRLEQEMSRIIFNIVIFISKAEIVF